MAWIRHFYEWPQPADNIEFLYDTFTDTAGTTLTSHAGEVGAIWTADTAATLAINPSGLLSNSSGSSAEYTASGVPPGRNYRVDMVVSFTSLLGSVVGPSARNQVGNRAKYAVIVSSSEVQIRKYSTTGTASIVARASVTIETPNDHTVSIAVVDDVIHAFFNDELVATYVDNAYYDGRAGILAVTNTNQKISSVRGFTYSTMSNVRHRLVGQTVNLALPPDTATGSVFVEDSFTAASGTLVTARSGETGATWTSSDGGVATIGPSGDAAYLSTSGTMVASGTAVHRDMDVDFTFRYLSTTNSLLVGGRYDPATGAYYYISVTGSSGLSTGKFSGGSYTSLSTITFGNGTFVAGGEYSTRLQLRDAKKALIYNGGEMSSTTDNTLTAGQKAAVYGTVVTSTTGKHLLHITATNRGARAESLTVPQTVNITQLQVVAKTVGQTVAVRQVFSRTVAQTIALRHVNQTRTLAQTVAVRTLGHVRTATQSVAVKTLGHVRTSTQTVAVRTLGHVRTLIQTVAIRTAHPRTLVQTVAVTTIAHVRSVSQTIAVRTTHTGVVSQTVAVRVASTATVPQSVAIRRINQPRTVGQTIAVTTATSKTVVQTTAIRQLGLTGTVPQAIAIRTVHTASVSQAIAIEAVHVRAVPQSVAVLRVNQTRTVTQNVNIDLWIVVERTVVQSIAIKTIAHVRSVAQSVAMRTVHPRTVSQSVAVRIGHPRTVAQTIATERVDIPRTVGQTIALKTVGHIQSVPQSVAVKTASHLHTVPQTVRTAATETISVPQSVAVRLRFTTTAPQTVAIRRTFSNTVEQSVAVREVFTREVTQDLAVLTQNLLIVPQDIVLTIPTSQTVPQTVHVFKTETREVPQTVGVKEWVAFTRFVPQFVHIRTITNRLTVPQTVAVLRSNLARTVVQDIDIQTVKARSLSQQVHVRELDVARSVSTSVAIRTTSSITTPQTVAILDVKARAVAQDVAILRAFSRTTLQDAHILIADIERSLDQSVAVMTTAAHVVGQTITIQLTIPLTVRQVVVVDIYFPMAHDSVPGVFVTRGVSDAPAIATADIPNVFVDTMRVDDLIATTVPVAEAPAIALEEV